MVVLISILAFALTAGQLIRFPFLGGGITLLDLTAAFLSVYGLFKLKFKLKNPPFLKPALLFILIALFSLLLSPLRLTLSEYFISASYIARLFLYVLFAWIIFSTELKITKAFLLSGIAFAVLGLLQFIFFPNLDFLTFAGWDPHYFRTVSTFLDPNFAGAFFVLTLILIFQNLAMAKKWNTLFFIIVYVALLTTFSRSSYLMFLVSGLTFSVLKKSKKLVLITLILFIFLIFGFQTYTRLVSKPRNIDRTQSASFRFSTWQQGINLFQKAPILGVGFNAYRYGIKEFNLGDENFLKSHGSSSNDSSLLFVASTTGIIGLLVYLYFLFSLIKTKNEQVLFFENKIVIAAILGLLVHSLFANSLFYPPILAWILLISITPKK